MEYLNLKISNDIVDGKTRRITILQEDGISKNIEIFYEFDRVIPWSDSTLFDGNVFAILLYAMSRGKDLKVHGPVSRRAMRNLEELQLAWCMWNPSEFKKIKIIPKTVVDTIKTKKTSKAISAFSGGVDAVFTALNQCKILSEVTSYPLSSVLMVHGFDVEIYNYNGFKQLVERVRPFLDDLNLDLRTVRTNSRELKLQNWDYSHGLELASCLHMFCDEFEFGLIGSGDPYDGMVLPWGSNPVTDHLISGGEFSIIHDGAGYSRTDKVYIIKNYPLACKILKVCWASIDQSGNCGKCEKCVRTKLNFLAAGVTKMPTCFNEELDINIINKIIINTDAQFVEIVSISRYAKNHNVTGEWLDILNKRIAEWKPTDAKIIARKKNGNILKRALIDILRGIGCAEAAKKIWRSLKRAMLG